MSRTALQTDVGVASEKVPCDSGPVTLLNDVFHINVAAVLIYLLEGQFVRGNMLLEI